ncbi:transmembrane protein 53-like lethal (2) k09913 isoform X1 [Andrena cerasifolii]|uniref:transmembrane protein 53-like lethal (2) k09913 isoform X1 n=2 Tax=Andrena cerasifolii TaxID=2819439 RepID=UPI004037CC6C
MGQLILSNDPLAHRSIYRVALNTNISNLLVESVECYRQSRILLAMMIVGRTLSSTLARTRLFSFAQSQLLNRRQDLTLLLLVSKLSSHRIGKNIEHITIDHRIKSFDGARRNFENTENRPLLVMLTWLLAKRRNVMKYANLYMDQGFDVAVVSMTPWQLLWPVKGSRVVAADLLDFLIQHEDYQQILLHGFSVGGYMWGEVLDLIERDRQKYGNVIDRIIGQVWDSLADVSELSIGTPRAVFPKNEMLQNMLRKYLEYHMKTFQKQSTQYYVRSSQLFHSNSVHSPALFFISNTDPVGTLTNNLRVRAQWESLGVKTYVKIFERSPHVGHYYKYPKEYVAELYGFLNKLNLIQMEEKKRALV